MTYQLPLEDALGRMDSGGPLEGLPCKWGERSTQELGLQEFDPTGTKSLVMGPVGERQALSTVKPDPRLKDLMSNRTPVILLEVYAALAPRDAVREQGLGEVIKAEMMQLLHRAKAEGRVVIFNVCSDEPHELAEKVYLRPAFRQHGLCCGYLRWRPSACSPWAAERFKGLCLGLQMP